MQVAQGQGLVRDYALVQDGDLSVSTTFWQRLTRAVCEA